MAAKASTEYAEAKDAQFTVLEQYEAMRNKRGTEAIVIETWRTIQANRRRGDV